MQKTNAMLIVVSGVVALGMILSFYGNQVLFEDLARGEGSIAVGEELTVMAELTKSDSQNGIYAIQIIDHREDISVHILDPYGSEIVSKMINEELLEGMFAIDFDGTYTVVVKNDSPDTAEVFAVIGPEPDAGAKSIGFVSLYILVIGLIGMIGVGVLVVRKRRRV